MAESQLMCMDDGHVNETIPESKPEYYYSEEQRAAIEQLLTNGDGAFKMRLKEDKVKDFLSAREIKRIRDTLREYETHGETDKAKSGSTKESKADSGVHSTYWPDLSDTEIPPLDIGWTEGGLYKAATRVAVHTHPAKQNGPHIKEVVRRLIQESNKVVAVVMDLLTDLLILQDLLDAAAKRSVAVYIILDSPGVPHFLDMCSRLQVGPMHLRNLRVRMMDGCGLALPQGRLPGALCSKYMLVDGDKVMFGSYSFTWSTSRMDRNVITVMTGQVLDVFDRDFRELYAMSAGVDLYKEFHVTKPPKPLPVRHAPSLRTSTGVYTSRFQVSLGDSRQANFKVPAHKYHNPKYLLVVGNTAAAAAAASGARGSLPDLSSRRGSLGGQSAFNVMERFLQSSGGSEMPEEPGPLPASAAPAAEHRAKDARRPNGPAEKKRSSFRLFLKGKGAQPSVPEEGELTPTPSGAASPTRRGPGASPEDSFEERPSQPKVKTKKKVLHQRSVSLQAVNLDDESVKGRQRKGKKNCIQS
ncbi:protein FAM83F-like [Conger conger]|uniref:protein FAM83F-like n=1 Tax=Conger conger TaxID=82655 RepID=UPI002A59BBBF|nr:protein FAM83F-like [Conger conger]